MTLPIILLVSKMSLYFNIEWNTFNLVSPSTIPTKNYIFFDSKAWALEYFSLYSSPPTSYCPFSICFNNYCEISAAPTQATSAFNSDHTSWPLTACCSCTGDYSAFGDVTEVPPKLVLPPPKFPCPIFHPWIIQFIIVSGDTSTGFLPTVAYSVDNHGWCNF